MQLTVTKRKEKKRRERKRKRKAERKKDRIGFPPAPTSSRASHEAQIIKLGHLILHDRRRVAQLAAPVLVVARPHGDQRAVGHLAQGDHLERDGQRLVRAPMRRQRRAYDQRTSGAHHLARVLGQQLVQQLLARKHKIGGHDRGNRVLLIRIYYNLHTIDVAAAAAAGAHSGLCSVVEDSSGEHKKKIFESYNSRG